MTALKKKEKKLPTLTVLLTLNLQSISSSFRDVRLLILERSRWSMVDKYQALSAGLKVEELMEFSRSFRAELFAEGLVQGNFSSAVSAEQKPD